MLCTNKSNKVKAFANCRTFDAIIFLYNISISIAQRQKNVYFCQYNTELKKNTVFESQYLVLYKYFTLFRPNFDGRISMVFPIIWLYTNLILDFRRLSIWFYFVLFSTNWYVNNQMLTRKSTGNDYNGV